MVETKDFYDYLVNNDIDFFAGVPDSLLSNLCACIKMNTSNEKNNNLGSCAGSDSPGCKSSEPLCADLVHQ